MLQVSNTTTKNGIVQFYEKELGFRYGDVSGNSELLAEFIARSNMALDNYLLLWAKSAGTWQGDDINHSDFQIISTTIESGKRDYVFTTDENNNRIFDVSKVLIKTSATATEYTPISPVDELNTDINGILTDSTTGTPSRYAKLGNSILFDVIPDYTVSKGIKIVINRAGSYFTTSDTTKVIGVPVYPEYMYLKPAYEYARINNHANLAQLEKEIIDLEGSERLRIKGKIQEFFGSRERDVKKQITNKKILYI
jgi:hypothetical protein